MVTLQYSMNNTAKKLCTKLKPTMKLTTKFMKSAAKKESTKKRFTEIKAESVQIVCTANIRQYGLQYTTI